MTPRSSGHKRPARFGGTSPPGTYRLCSSCAHRAPFRYGSELTGSAETAPAKASPRTAIACEEHWHTVQACLPSSLHHLAARLTNCQPECRLGYCESGTNGSMREKEIKEKAVKKKKPRPDVHGLNKSRKYFNTNFTFKWQMPREPGEENAGRFAWQGIQSSPRSCLFRQGPAAEKAGKRWPAGFPVA